MSLVPLATFQIPDWDTTQSSATLDRISNQGVHLALASPLLILATSVSCTGPGFYRNVTCIIPTSLGV